MGNLVSEGGGLADGVDVVLCKAGVDVLVGVELGSNTWINISGIHPRRPSSSRISIQIRP